MTENRRRYRVSKELDDTSGDIAIIFASYGGMTEESRMDVTELIKGMVVGSGLSVTATNDVMGRDPAPGVVKTLEVTCSVGDSEYTEVVPETWVMRIGKRAVAEVAEREEVDIIQAVLSDPEEYDTGEYSPSSTKTRTSSGGVA